MLNEFRKFILRGNVIDLAVGVIIGGAFNKIVSSLVEDILTPILSLFLGRLDFRNLFIPLDGGQYAVVDEAVAKGVATINYGLFISSVIDFLIMGFVIFLLVKMINKLHSKASAPTAEEAPALDIKKCPYCFTEIDLHATRCPHCTSHLEEGAITG